MAGLHTLVLASGGASLLGGILLWPVIAFLCAAFVYGIGRLSFWKKSTAPEVLFIALCFIIWGIANIDLEGVAYASTYRFYVSPVRILFFLLFFVFVHDRFKWSEARWLLLFPSAIVLGIVSAQSSNKALFIAPIWLEGVHVAAIGLFMIPQLSLFRDHAPPGERRLPGWVYPGLGLGVILLSASAWLSRIDNTTLPFFLARSAWFLLMSLVPTSLGFALLRARTYDRPAVLRRIALYGILVITISAIYLASLAVGEQLISPSLNIPFATLIPAFFLAAFLYRPLFHYLQGMIDHLFYPRLEAIQRRFADFEPILRAQPSAEILSQQLVDVVLAAMPAQPIVMLWGNAQLDAGSDALVAMTTYGDQARRKVSPAAWIMSCLSQKPLTFAVPPSITVPPTDPLSQALLQMPITIPLAPLAAISPAAARFQSTGVASVLPIRERGEFVGLLALGQQPDSFDERDLLATSCAQVAPTLYVALFLHQKERQQRDRERVEQELQTARRIQQAFLPQTIPDIVGWQIAPTYRPAREVGGDFYDFLRLADGRLGLIIGDVTGKGVPSALVMATTRSMLRAVAQQVPAPGAVLAQVNDLLCPDLPPSMYVTCFYAILDPVTGDLRYANAGHELPYCAQAGTVVELHARGMPLGLMPAMRYEEQAMTLAPGATVLFYTDGIDEAHNHQGEMFGYERLRSLLGASSGSPDLTARVLTALMDFTQPNWEQEDDITLVLLQRSGEAAERPVRLIEAWSMPSIPGNEQEALQRVRQAAQRLGLEGERLEQLGTAVAEATLNAMEHGNGYQPDLLVDFVILAAGKEPSNPTDILVQISDQGDAPFDLTAPAPDLLAKLAGDQSPRGWGLYLIKQLVDDLRIVTMTPHHTIELRMALHPIEQAEASTHTEDPLPSEAPADPSTQASGPNPGASPDVFTERTSAMQSPDVMLTVHHLTPAIARIDVQGIITAAVENQLNQAYAAANTPTTRSIIINFTGLTYMNSIGIGLLVTLLIRMKRNKQSLLAYGLSEHYRHIFQLTRLDEAIILTTTEDEAIQAAAR